MMFLLLSIFCINACSTSKSFNDTLLTENLQEDNLKNFVGKRITIIGKTVNMKLGAVLVLDNGQRIWMKDMESWPNDYYFGLDDKKTKTVKVTGILIEKNDLPVFIPKKNDSIIQQGIQMPEETDLKEASKRFLLKNYKWEEIK